jgi:NhaP-type Na+/H+ or K+/H+ antiporter
VLSETEILVSIATIAVFGVGAQWIGRRLGFPSLLLLLPAGLLAGDVLGLVEPEKLLGDLLFPLVTLLVSLLLFQSGLQLRFADLPKDAREPVVRLLTLGLLITFLGASLAALAILEIATDLAFLLGAIIVVSGPTVVGPLLATVRAREPTSSVLEYEGAFLDPLGATLGVVMLSLVLAGDAGDVNPLLQILGRFGLGVAVGLVAAGLLVAVMSRFLLSFDMEAAVAVMLAVVAFVAADAVLSEAGLFATLTFGVAMANQRRVSLRTVRAFGGTLEVLIIGALFILLGALVTIDGLREYAWQIIALVAVLVIIVRPLTAFVSLVRTKLPWRDRALISWVDPRGIVAASTAASFAGSLAAAGVASEFLLPVVFGVILGTGVVYGLSAKPLAGLLGVATPPPKGVVLLGNADWLLDLARELTRVGASVLVMTAESPGAAQADRARAQSPVVSLRDSQANIAQAIRAADVAEVVICAPAYALLNVVDVALIRRYGRRRVLRLPDRRETAGLGRRVLAHRSAHPFTPGVTLQDIDELVRSGSRVEAMDQMGPDAVPLAAVRPDGSVNLQPGKDAPSPGDRLIGLVGGSG